MAMENQMKDNAGAPSVESLVKRGYLFLEDSEWNKADEYFDKALDINPEHAPAYIGKLCAELMVRREESLSDYKELRQGKKFNKLLGEYAHFQKALRFADDGYLKKLNGYDQKIKENFPKTIPQQFTDEFIKGEITRLENEIANCGAEITECEKQASSCKSLADSYMNENQKYRDIYKGGFYTADEIREKLRCDDYYQSNVKFEEEMRNNMRDYQQRVSEYTRKKAEYEAKKRNLEPLAGISCLDRMDNHYNRLVEAMQKESTEDEYKNFAEQFRSLEGFKESAELADKCDKLADEYVKREKKARYDALIKEKNNASSEGKFNQLAAEFRKMGVYENAAQLANECDKLADECGKREKKERYDALVQAKNNASSEGKYKQLAQEFREMGGYENAAQLANECDKQFNELKKQREEQERQEKVRKTAREAEERDEERRRYRYEEEQRRRKERAKNITGLMLTFVPFILGMLLYVIGDHSNRLDFVILNLIAALIFFGIPIVRIHFRDEILPVISIIIFILAIILKTIFLLQDNENILGSLAMVAAFTMAIAYPKDKYWE